jgi:hydroxymethylbilane synthase
VPLRSWTEEERVANRRLRVGVLDVESGNLHGVWLREQFDAHLPGQEVTLEAIGPAPRRSGRSAKGARIPIRAFYSEPIHRALIEERIDVGVHRMKDIPVPLPEGVRIAAVTERKTPLDVLVTADGAILDDLEEGARLGVSSLRREAQLTRYRPDLEIEFIVGTLSERIGLTEAGKAAGVVVAAAGIEWRGWQDRVSEVFTAQICLPAPGQGALGLLVRADDAEAAARVRFLNHTISHQEVEAERSFLETLQAWDGSPVAALARVRGDILRVEGCVCSLGGGEVLRDWAEGFPEDPLRTGERLGRKLIEQGAPELLERTLREAALE